MINKELLLINEKESIKDALIAIKNNKSRHALVTNDKSMVIGIISEGDIINALLKGSDISSKILPITNNSFIFINENDLSDSDKILSILKQGILIIPVLDNNMKLVDIINYMDFLK
jgi:CBS domain-containing protein